ncbi:hypothetical protein CEXT_313841 [Caerostris extrusa]|uniref:Uncharacterized protein n=1 Tax=Caerostris extrusa TaxID=172846 RepID=A0AAV4QEP9_CAEEX|nr:hypothetical protein CEXT_313841 [Caerostris extrusa]
MAQWIVGFDLLLDKLRIAMDFFFFHKEDSKYPVSREKPSRPSPTPSEKKVTDCTNPTTSRTFLQVTKTERAPLPTATVKSKLQEKPPGLNQTNPSPTKREFY